MDPDGSLWSYMILLLVLIGINAFFAMSEMAIVSLNDNKVRKQAAEGDKKAGMLVSLLDRPSNFLATIQVGVTLSGFLASAVAADTFAARITRAVVIQGISPSIIRIASLIVITLLLSYLTLVFGELVPKRIAMHNADKIARSVIRPLLFLYKIERPFVALLSASTNAVLRLFGINPGHKPEQVTEEEIRMMIDVGEESGHIEQSDKDMINNIFEFDDRDVSELMTHRTEITAVEIDTPLEEIVEAATESGYSRIPVYEDDLDTIIGILYVKDLLSLIGHRDRRTFDLREYMRAPYYVPESTTGKSLLTIFKEKKIQMAVVVDEYGGTSGLVTMEDLLESIVGNIQDEYDDEEEEITRLRENMYLVDGLTAIEDVSRFFALEIDDEDEFDTIGGYLVNRLGYIPGEEEYPSVRVGDIVLTVRQMDDRRVAKIEVERLAEEPDHVEEPSA